MQCKIDKFGADRYDNFQLRVSLVGNEVRTHGGDNGSRKWELKVQGMGDFVLVCNLFLFPFDYVRCQCLWLRFHARFSSS